MQLHLGILNSWKVNCSLQPDCTLLFFFVLFLMVCSVFSCSVMSDSLRPHGLQHARLPVLHFSRSLLKVMSIELVMLSNHLILLRIKPSIINLFTIFYFFQYEFQSFMYQGNTSKRLWQIPIDCSCDVCETAPSVKNSVQFPFLSPCFAFYGVSTFFFSLLSRLVNILSSACMTYPSTVFLSLPSLLLQISFYLETGYKCS